MRMEVSERTKQQLEASHHCFNESTFQRKLDFFDTCLGNDESELSSPEGVRKAVSQRKPAQDSTDSLYLNESTMDFLIEENIEEKKSPKKPANESTGTDHGGALEALFSSNPNPAPRCKSVSSNGGVPNHKRKSRISGLFNKRKSKGIDCLPEMPEEEGDEALQPEKIAPLIMEVKPKQPAAPTQPSISPKLQHKVGASEEEDWPRPKETGKPSSHSSRESAASKDTTKESKRLLVAINAEEASQTTNTTASLSTMVEERTTPQNSPAPSKRKGIRRKDLYGTRQNSRRSLSENTDNRGDDPRRAGRKRPTSQPRRQGSNRQLNAEASSQDGSAGEERRAPRKGTRKSRAEQTGDASSSDNMTTSDHRGPSRRNLTDPLSRTDHRSPRRSAAMDSLSRSDHGAPRKRTTDPLSRSTDHGAPLSRSSGRSSTRDVGSDKPGRQRSLSRSGASSSARSPGRRSKSASGTRSRSGRKKLSKPESARKIESSASATRGRSPAPHLSNGDRQNHEKSSDQPRRGRSSRVIVSSSSMSPRRTNTSKASSARFSSRRQASLRDLGAEGRKESSANRETARRRRQRSSRNLHAGENASNSDSKNRASSSSPVPEQKEQPKTTPDGFPVENPIADKDEPSPQGLRRPKSFVTLPSSGSPPRPDTMKRMDSVGSFFGTTGGSMGMAVPANKTPNGGNKPRARVSTGDINGMLHSVRRETGQHLIHQQRSSRRLGATA